MRLAHLADLHLGFRQYHRLTARGLNQREADVARAFTTAVDDVIAAGPDAVVVSGDLFHAVRPTNSAILHAVREFSRLRRLLPEAPIIVIAGNHDTPRSTDTVSIFGLLHEIGLHVAADEPRRFAFPALGLSVLAVPHQALFATPRPALEPAGSEPHQVLMLHGETPGLFASERDRAAAEAGGAYLTPEDLGSGRWSHVALGHYHVQQEVGERAWYSGSLEYVSPNPWAELREEARQRIPGKGWLLVDLASGAVVRQPIAAPRRVIDLPALDATELAASELDRLLAAAVEDVAGGIDDAVVRQVVRNVARPVARELDHAAIRQWKARALHFHLDLRRPEVGARTVGVGAPGERRTLADTVESYLGARALPAGVDRGRFVAEGVETLAALEREAQEG
ncbi:MAG TPA: DNA repair exonuclease [Gemmatimonadales bacterium]|nr:DNA repair exonuclease [Gemmatimonadales bacterium]